MMRFKKYLPILLIISLSILAWYLGIGHYFNLEVIKAHYLDLQLFVQHNLILSILIYCGIYISVVGLSIPGATFMTLAGGILFGQWVGTIGTVIAATIGASLVFMSAKMASTDLLSKKAGSWIAKMQNGFQENAFFYLLTLRLIPLFPFFAINLAAAFFQISLRAFFFGTLLGIIPGSFVYVSLGVALQEVIQKPKFSPSLVLDPKILFTFIGLGVLSLLPVLYTRLTKNRS